MIANNAFNRIKIREYLDSVGEDDFIDEVVIPLFSKNGYILFRRNTHGPGEHGKDLIFYRHVKLFYDNEYIAVQAKAQQVRATNVTEFANQLVRAFKVPFPGGKGKSGLFPNYVYFINSQGHTSDANFEFPYLADMKDNIKIIDGSLVIELMIEFDIIPTPLRDTVEEYEQVASDDYDEEVRNTILTNDNNQINKLLDYQLKITTSTLSDKTKGLIINYIFDKWENDRSWEGTVKPMKWLSRYFDYIQPNQYDKLFLVYQEYLSTYPSRAAEADTYEIIRSIEPKHTAAFQDEFMKKVVEEIRNNGASKYPELIKKYTEFVNSDSFDEKDNDIKNEIQNYLDIREEIRNTKDENTLVELRNKLQESSNELYYYLYPEERE
ncbi:MAG: hypothetical protein H6550_00920 [Chitinophagales bacterium]|nr:hypothetical protein [Chitinophagales bacterium]